MTDKTIKFKNLSAPLKIAIITAWLYTIILATSFLAGVIHGILE